MNHANAGRSPGFRREWEKAVMAVLPVFPPSRTDWRPFGSDVWEGYGQIDWGKMKAHTDPAVDFVLIRSGQGHPTFGPVEAFYKDPQFASNVYQAVTLGIPWMQYHVFLPNYSDTRQQVEYAYQLAEETGHLPCALWWDHQLKSGVGAQTINDRLREVIRYSETFSSDIKRIGIYSAKWVFEQIAGFRPWMQSVDFWWAKWMNTQESTGVIQRDLPDGMDLSQVKIQQTTSQGDGKLLGSKMRRMTFDRSMLPKEDLYRWLGIETDEPDPDWVLRLKALEYWREQVGEVT